MNEGVGEGGREGQDRRRGRKRRRTQEIISAASLKFLQGQGPKIINVLTYCDAQQRFQLSRHVINYVCETNGRREGSQVDPDALRRYPRE